MAWLPIDPRYLRQPPSAGRTLAYVSRRPRDGGNLVLHLDGRGAVERFELTHAPFPSRIQLVAVWDRTTGLRVGELDDGRGGRDGPGRTGLAPVPGSRPYASPLVRRYRYPQAADVARLLAYVEQNAAPLDARHRATVLDALRNGLTGPLDDASPAP